MSFKGKKKKDDYNEEGKVENFYLYEDESIFIFIFFVFKKKIVINIEDVP